jgi:hypothetical protein
VGHFTQTRCFLVQIALFWTRINKTKVFLVILGTIVTTGPLDRETTAQYTLQVTATDGIQSSSCMVRINLRDINDNAPKFPQSFYSFDIDEDTLIDTTVGSVRANDPDQGLNGQVTYSLKAGWGNDTFSLDPVKGTFTLLRLLDFEEVWLSKCNLTLNILF